MYVELIILQIKDSVLFKLSSFQKQKNSATCFVHLKIEKTGRERSKTH